MFIIINYTIFEVLKQIYPSHIQVSLYSLHAEIHDSITNLPGSHAKTMDGINLCYENDIPIQVNCPIIEINRNCFEDVIKWANGKYIKWGPYLNNSFAID